MHRGVSAYYSHTSYVAQVVEVTVNNRIDPTGLGEPGLPPISAALAHALYQATGERLYGQPYIEQMEGDELAVAG